MTIYDPIIDFLPMVKYVDTLTGELVNPMGPDSNQIPITSNVTVLFNFTKGE